MNELNRNKYEQAIIRNADWFIAKQKKEGYINVDGDEFYGIKGDATLVGHSVTVRMYAYKLTNEKRYLESAQRSLNWLAERQGQNGGWKKYTAFTLDGAQCVFEGFNSYFQIYHDDQYRKVLERAAERMIAGTISKEGKLLLPNIIEIGEYAHFSLLAWKTTGNEKYKESVEIILKYISENFDEEEGMWNPYDKDKEEPKYAYLVKPLLQWVMGHLPLKGKPVARISDHLLPYVTAKTHPQYSMSLINAEILLDTLDESCSYPNITYQTERAITWANQFCKGPFPGSLCESRKTERSKQAYPLTVINDTKRAATWPTACLLIAYCGLSDLKYREEAMRCADYILTIQDESGGFRNFQNAEGTFPSLQSGNVNFYASMALWLFNEVYENGDLKLFMN